MNHIVCIVFDSARYDAYESARTPYLDSIQRAERRWSFASWTLPAHHVLLMGAMPHRNQPKTLASVQYREDLSQWSNRIRPDCRKSVSFQDFLPAMSLPLYLRSLGYCCQAYVSLPVLNPHTVFATHFDRFELMPQHNDFATIVDRLRFPDHRPHFYLINTGETHYPYLLPGEQTDDLPYLQGLHGVWRNLDAFLDSPLAHRDQAEISFEPTRLSRLWEKQVACIEYLDHQVARLLEVSPLNTWFIILSDHGELFGEDGFFGHGPIMHEKVFEVFCLEGLHP